MIKFLVVLLIDDRFSKPIVVFRGENAAHEFNKNLIMIEEEKQLFQQSNSCWICEKPIDRDNEKVREKVMENLEAQLIGIAT